MDLINKSLELLVVELVTPLESLVKPCQWLFKETRSHGIRWSPAEGCAPALWA